MGSWTVPSRVNESLLFRLLRPHFHLVARIVMVGSYDKISRRSHPQQQHAQWFRILKFVITLLNGLFIVSSLLNLFHAKLKRLASHPRTSVFSFVSLHIVLSL